MLERYVQAFWAKDVNALVTMLAHDAVWEMPPFTGWYAGVENIAELIDTQCPGGVHDMPMIRTPANGQPAFGLYMRQPDGHFEPFHLQVLQIVDGRVTHVGAFFEPGCSRPSGCRPPCRRRTPHGLAGDMATTSPPRSVAVLDSAVDLDPRCLQQARADVPVRADAVRRLGPRAPAAPHGGLADRHRRGRGARHTSTSPRPPERAAATDRRPHRAARLHHRRPRGCDG